MKKEDFQFEKNYFNSFSNICVSLERSEKGMEFEMDKKVRNAVRTYLIENNKVVVIKNKCEVNKDFYDIPGGKIENNESDVDAAKREFKEETGMQIIETNNN